MKIKIEMDVTPPQALALQAMFKYWDHLANIGSSRYVAFFVDGDGNFHPHCKTNFIYKPDEKEIPPLTNELEQLAIMEEDNGDRKYDFDPIAWKINHDDN